MNDVIMRNNSVITNNSMLLQGLIGTGAPIRHPRALCTLSKSFPAILIRDQSLQSEVFYCSTGNPTQSESIHHYYILLNIIKINYF